MCNTTTTISPAASFVYEFSVLVRDRRAESGWSLFETYAQEMTEYDASYHAWIKQRLTGRLVVYKKKP
jgi:hypothetical protein